MTKTRKVLAAACATAILSLPACYSAPIMPPAGLLYSEINAPISIGPSDMGSRRGEATSIAVLGLFAYGDCSVKTAATEGGITTVKHLDYAYFNFLGLYQKFTTIAHGD